MIIIMPLFEHISFHHTGIKHHMFGKHQSKDQKRKMSERMKGKKNPFYGKHHSIETKRLLSEKHKKKNKKIFYYKYVWSADHQRSILEHRFIMENWLKEFNPTHESLMEINGKKFLKKGWVVHHIDGNEQNNSIENLDLMKNHSKHITFHHAKRCING